VSDGRGVNLRPPNHATIEDRARFLCRACGCGSDRTHRHACACCGAVAALVLDHCHVTRRARAYVCLRCNARIGRAETRAARVIENDLAHYLRRYGTQEAPIFKTPPAQLRAARRYKINRLWRQLGAPALDDAELSVLGLQKAADVRRFAAAPGISIGEALQRSAGA